MRLNKALIGSIAVSALLAGAAFAQSISVPTVSSVATGDLVQVVPQGVPSAGNKYANVSTIKTYANSGGTAGAGVFTTVTATGLTSAGGGVQVDTGTKTATATAGAATLNKLAGVITSETLTTAAGATYTLTLTDSSIAAADQVFASVQLGTATTGMPTVTTVTPAAGSVVIIVQNIHASAALNGTIKISFMDVKN